MKLHDKHLLHFGRWTMIGLAVLLTTGFAGSSQATEITSLDFLSEGPDTGNTGNINNSTIFTMGGVFSKIAGEHGVFVGLPIESFGSVSFNTTNPTSFAFGNSVFGDFASTSIQQLTNVPGAVAFLISGDWTPGTFSGFQHLTRGPFPAMVTVTFNQTPAHTGSISSSFTLAASTSPIPEPGSLGLLGTGLTGLAVLARRKFKHGTKSEDSNCC